MDLWDRHSRQREGGSSDGPAGGACPGVPGAAGRQMEKRQGNEREVGCSQEARMLSSYLDHQRNRL